MDQDLVEKYMRTYGNRYECPSPRAKKLREIFVRECQKYGILYEMKDIIHAYKHKYEIRQLSLFDI